MAEKKSIPFLEVRNLSVHYTSEGKQIHAVNDVSLSVEKGKTLGLVGETGAGKTTIAKSILRILPEPPAHLDQGEILLEGTDLLKLNHLDIQKIRGKRISMIFQDPMTALNPVMRVGDQIAEGIALHEKVSKKEASEKAEKMLEMVGIPASRSKDYPHQFSGGMKQRVVIAMALACSPDLLLADEPTTALDVTIQAQVLDIIKELQEKLNTSMIMITHDLGIVAEVCDSVAVIYAGEVVEYGSLEEIFDRPSHPYTVGLFGSLPDVNSEVDRLSPIDGMPPDPSALPEGCAFAPRCPYASDACRKEKIKLENLGGTHTCRCLRCKKEENRAKKAGEGAQTIEKTQKRENPPGHVHGNTKKEKANPDGTPLVEVRHLKKYFDTPKGMLHAVDDVTFSIEKGKTMGVVGESGCGKSTLGRTMIHLYESTDGQILFEGEDVTHVRKRKLHDLRERMQIIFQDPFASLNPRMTVEETIREPLELSRKYRGSALMDRTEEILNMVGIDDRLRHSYPHELDGGRRQRVGIGRALALNPAFVVCDEPVSALDVSIQAQVLNLLQDLQEKSGVTYMFVTHDLSVVKHISDKICVMYLGQLVETTTSRELFAHPLHPYTRALLSAIPSIDIHNRKKRVVLEGEIVSPVNPKPGCRFAARCPYATETCHQPQTLRELSKGHFVSCCRAEELI